jgi:hypothetical protein
MLMKLSRHTGPKMMLGGGYNKKRKEKMRRG